MMSTLQAGGFTPALSPSQSLFLSLDTHTMTTLLWSVEAVEHLCETEQKSLSLYEITLQFKIKFAVFTRLL
jgi:hypothetical protein